MSHEAIEIDRAGRADVTRVVGNFRYRRDKCFEILDGGRGSFERGAFVEVEYQQQFIFVIERQHLEGHHPHGRQPHGGDCQTSDGEQEYPRSHFGSKQRRHERAKDAIQARLLHHVRIVQFVLRVSRVSW